MTNRDSIKKMTETAMMTALYVVLSMFINIPIINRIVLEVGYVVLGACTTFMNSYQLMFIGGVGCVLKAMMTGGNFPFGWLPAQLVLCFFLGNVKKIEKMPVRIIWSIALVFLCICGLKTLIEVPLYQLPFWAKLGSNSVAAISDAAGLFLGMLITMKYRLK